MNTDQIVQQVKTAVLNIYEEEDIDAAFITGSIAAGKQRADSDVDIFVCYQDSVISPAIKKQAFVHFYFELHQKLHRTPDAISPGEILSFTELNDAIHRIRQRLPSTILSEREDFDAICWAGMLVSKKITLMPDSAEMRDLINVSRSVAANWAAWLEPELILTEGTGEYTDLDKVLRRGISCPGYYDAH